jgi:LysR family transcriptional regulator, nitrogen assimilation regulatory protein
MALDLKRRVFLANVCEKRSLTAAASLSRVTQLVLSYHLAELERTVGEPLLHRRPDRWRRAGRGRPGAARPCKGGHRSSRRSGTRHARPAPPSGWRCFVGLLASIAPAVAQRLLHDCKTRFPLIRLSISEGTSLQLRAGVDDNQFDLAVNLRERGDDASHSLLFEDLYLVARRGVIDLRKENVSLAEALQHKPLLPPKGHVVRALLDEAARKHGLMVQTEAEIEGLATLKSLVAASISPAILDFGAIKSEYKSGVFVAARISRPSGQRELVLDEAAKRLHPKAAEEIKAIVIRVIQDLAR